MKVSIPTTIEINHDDIYQGSKGNSIFSPVSIALARSLGLQWGYYGIKDKGYFIDTYPKIIIIRTPDDGKIELTVGKNLNRWLEIYDTSGIVYPTAITIQKSTIEIY